MRLDQAAREVDDLLTNYQFSQAYERVYGFIWNDFADWYIEASKTTLNKELLWHVLTASLKIAHPFAPFITETVWQEMGMNNGGLLIRESWPEPLEYDSRLADEFQDVKELIVEIRAIQTALVSHFNDLYHRGSKLIANNTEVIQRLAKVREALDVDSGKGIHLKTNKAEAWLDINQLIIGDYRQKQADQIKSIEESIAKLKGRLDNPSYAKNAPKELVDQTRSQLKNEEDRLAIAKSDLERLGG